MAAAAKESLGVKLIAWTVVAAIIPAILAVVSSAQQLLVSAFDWLRTGTWQAPSFWDFLHRIGLDQRPATGWVVPDAILNWFLDGAGWFWVAFFALLYLGGVIWLIVASESGLRRLRQWFKRQAPTA